MLQCPPYNAPCFLTARLHASEKRTERKRCRSLCCDTFSEERRFNTSFVRQQRNVAGYATHTHKKRTEKGISLRTSKFKSTRIFCNLSMPERPGSLLSSLQSTRVQTGKAPDRFPFPPRDVERTPYPAPKTARKVEDRAARYDLRSAHDLSRRRRETKGEGIGSRARANRSSRRRFSLQKKRLASWRAGHPDAPAAVNTVRGPKTAAEAVPGKRGGKRETGGGVAIVTPPNARSQQRRRVAHREGRRLRRGGKPAAGLLATMPEQRRASVHSAAAERPRGRGRLVRAEQ